MTELENEQSESLDSTLQEQLESAMAEAKSEPEDDIVEEIEDKEVTEVNESEAVEDIEEEEEEEEEVEESVDEIKAPSSFNKQETEWFDDLDEESQEILSKFEKSRQSDYTKKMQGISESKKEMEMLDILFDPYKDNLKGLGLTRTSYISQLIGYDKSLTQDPSATIKNLIDKYNVKPEDLGIKRIEDTDDLDEYTNELLEKNEQLINENANLKRTNQRTQAESDTGKQVLEFQYARNDKGSLLHPHMDNEVMDEMLIVLQSGQAASLEDAYNKSPTVKMRVMATPKDSLSDTRKKAAKAKKAATSVKSKSAKNVAPDFSSMSLKDELTYRMRKAH